MEERQYRYEMHLHTAEGSRCADRTVEEQLTLYRDLGYAGVCLTDHDILSAATPPPIPNGSFLWITRCTPSQRRLNRRIPPKIPLNA